MPAALDDEQIHRLIRAALNQQCVAGDPVAARATLAVVTQPVEVADRAGFALLNLAGLAFRCQITAPTGRLLELPVLLTALDFEGSLQEVPAELAAATLVYAAAVAGGLRPAYQPLAEAHRPQLLAASWLTAVTAVRWASDITRTPPGGVLDTIFDELGPLTNAR